MKPELQKDKAIIQVLDKLRARSEVGAFDVVDHWNADLCAIGIARTDDHGVLVYISTFGKREGEYFVSLELPPRPGEEQWANHPYTPAGEQDAKTFDELVEIIQGHFSYAS